MKPLCEGSRDADVMVMQRRLKARGIAVTIDGLYGPATTKAVREFQSSIGLVADGIAGEKTQLALLDVGDPRHLRQADLERAAQKLSVPVEAVMAVNEVESAGHGFSANGRPKILFERHVFRRLLHEKLSKTLTEQQLAEKLLGLEHAFPDLVNSKPGGYAGGSQEHARLALAAGIDPAVALQACSWGLFQIMGYHWGRLGYKSPGDFVEHMARSEGDQLDAFVRFIDTDPALLAALQGRKWAAFARIYNGPAYKKNLYDVKLQRAYEAHAGENHDV